MVMKGKKEFQINAFVYPGYRDVVIDFVVANNLREAWRLFKLKNKSYVRFRFHSAVTDERFYYKIY